MQPNRELALEFYMDSITDARRRDKHADEPFAVRAVQRSLCKFDLFYLMVFALRRKDMNRDFLYDRCLEVYDEPNGMLDLWAREHYKSTIITFGKTIQDILCDPTLTFGIFSHNRPIAKGFLGQIKREFEENKPLVDLFSDILWEFPERDAPKWSMADGIIVRRDTNPKESTVEAWGLVDGQPISKHFDVLVYDDVVTDKSVYTPEMLEKTLRAFELSLSLGSRGGAMRMIGTRYHFNDTYRHVIERGTAVPRIKPATDDGKDTGSPVFLTEPELKKKRQDMGPYTFGCQMLQDPVADKIMGFNYDWLRFYNYSSSAGWNVYMFVDPASSKKKNSDYTVIWVWGLSPDGHMYWLDCVRDRMNLTQRTAAFFKLHRKWQPMFCGYEQYGAQADIEHIESVMDAENYRVRITRLGGTMAKEDRIRRLIPDFEQGKIFLPYTLMYQDCEGHMHDLVKVFIEQEYTAFPVSTHDDMLDAASRIKDEDVHARHPRGAAWTQNRVRTTRGRGEYNVLNIGAR